MRCSSRWRRLRAPRASPWTGPVPRMPGCGPAVPGTRGVCLSVTGRGGGRGRGAPVLPHAAAAPLGRAPRARGGASDRASSWQRLALRQLGRPARCRRHARVVRGPLVHLGVAVPVLVRAGRRPVHPATAPAGRSTRYAKAADVGSCAAYISHWCSHHILEGSVYAGQTTTPAEADGNRTRLSEVLGHLGFEDREGHQAPTRLLARHDTRPSSPAFTRDTGRARHKVSGETPRAALHAQNGRDT